jgi:hypothetical protein
LSVNGEQPLNDLDCHEILQRALNVMGPKYREVMKKIASGVRIDGAGDELSLEFIQSRLKVLGGELSKSVSQSLGMASPQ